MRGATSVHRRGGGPLPEQNDWAHVMAALEHALSGIDAQMRATTRGYRVDGGPRKSQVSEDQNRDF